MTVILPRVLEWLVRCMKLRRDIERHYGNKSHQTLYSVFFPGDQHYL